MDVRLDVLSIDFDEELYPHMLTAIVGRMWMTGHGLRLAMMKCGESLELRQAFADVVLLDTPEACQDLVDHVAPPGYFFELRHLHNNEFLRQYNVSLARQVAMGSQLRLRFEQEAKLLRKSVAQVAHRDKRIQAREHEIKNLEALLEAEVDMKKATEDKSARLSQELEDMRALFSDLQ
nr:hypothetical protein [Tanacetum cinerariifolium]